MSEGTNLNQPTKTRLVRLFFNDAQGGGTYRDVRDEGDSYIPSVVNKPYKIDGVDCLASGFAYLPQQPKNRSVRLFFKDAEGNEVARKDVIDEGESYIPSVVNIVYSIGGEERLPSGFMYINLQDVEESAAVVEASLLVEV